jgi:hypothetical protein
MPEHRRGTVLPAARSKRRGERGAVVLNVLEYVECVGKVEPPLTSCERAPASHTAKRWKSSSRVATPIAITTQGVLAQ